MGKVNDAITKTECLIENALNDMRRLQNSFYDRGFDEYSLIYYQTNENVKEALQELNLDGKKNALCVAGSGDQAFSLIQRGIKDITLFDINRLAEYICLGLKMAMIDKYNYQDFINCNALFSDNMTKYSDVLELINDLTPNMPLKYRKYWRELIDFTNNYCKHYHSDFNLIYTLSIEKIDKNYTPPYFIDEDTYNNFKNKLYRANIRFQYADGTKIAKMMPHNYDILYLSNIIDYFAFSWFKNWRQEWLDAYIESLNRIMSQNGEAMVFYAFHPSVYGSYGSIRWSYANIDKTPGLSGKEIANNEKVYIRSRTNK